MTKAKAIESSTERTVPAELKRCLPRPVQLTASGGTVVGLGVFLIASALAVLAGLAGERAAAQERRERIEREGIATQAEVVENGVTKGENKKRFAVYRYEANGREYRGRVTLRKSDRRPAKRGDGLEIRYFSGEPGKSWVRGYEPGGLPLVLIALLPPGLAIGGVCTIWMVRRQRALLEDGRAAQARVVEVKRVLHDEHHGYKVQYEFKALSGAATRVKLEAKKKPEEGGVVTLLYDRENPKRCAVYPLPLVRVRRHS